MGGEEVGHIKENRCGKVLLLGVGVGLGVGEGEEKQKRGEEAGMSAPSHVQPCNICP